VHRIHLVQYTGSLTLCDDDCFIRQVYARCSALRPVSDAGLATQRPGVGSTPPSGDMSTMHGPICCFILILILLATLGIESETF
jgi:hypothetical protein